MKCICYYKKKKRVKKDLVLSLSLLPEDLYNNNRCMFVIVTVVVVHTDQHTQVDLYGVGCLGLMYTEVCFDWVSKVHTAKC